MAAFGHDITLADLESDPDPIFARLRAEAPVCFVDALDMWLVSCWDDLAHIEEHPELFTAATEPSFLARALGPNMLTCDPPEHTRLKSILQPPFLPGARTGDYVSNQLAAVADAQLDRLDPTGFDVMTDYAQQVSAASLSIVLGLDHHGADRMWSWCEGLCADIANFANDPAITAETAAVKRELETAVQDRISAADSDDAAAIGWFVREGATVAEIVNNVRLMISGGINEPRDGIGLVTWVLLTRPDLRKRIEQEPTKLRRLIEEVLRVFTPVGTVTRQTTRDVELGGVVIPEGALVAGVLRSVNLDERRWTNPTEIDLDRREGMHAAFALGTHRCLGEWFGRQQVKVGVERLLARFPGLAIDADEPPVVLHGFEFRGPTTLPVRPRVEESSTGFT